MSGAESTGSSSVGDRGERTKMKPSRNLTLGIPSYEDHKQESPPNTNLTLAVPSYEDHKQEWPPNTNLTLAVPSYEDHEQESPPNTNLTLASYLTLAVPSHEGHQQESPPNTNLTLAVPSNQDLSSKTTVEFHGKGNITVSPLSKRSRTIQDAMTGLTLAVGSRQDDHFGKTTGNITVSPPEKRSRITQDHDDRSTSNEEQKKSFPITNLTLSVGSHQDHSDQTTVEAHGVQENFLFEKRLSRTDVNFKRLLLPRASWYHFPALEIKTNINEGSSNPNMTQTYYFYDQIQNKLREMTVTKYDDRNVYIGYGWSVFGNDHKLNADDVVRFYRPTQPQQGDFLLNYKRAKPTDNDGNGKGEGSSGSGNTDHDQAQS